jgi:hypothetical protein
MGMGLMKNTYIPKQDNTNAEEAGIYIHTRDGKCNLEIIFPLLKDITCLVPHK